jgi:hypothetical protein
VSRIKRSRCVAHQVSLGSITDCPVNDQVNLGSIADCIGAQDQTARRRIEEALRDDD